jgi:putative transposase
MLKHQKNLRIGRFSQANQIYHVTFTTKNRAPIFRVFENARLLIKLLKQSDQQNHTSTLALVVMPDHVHWLFQLSNHHQLHNVIKTIKSKASIQIGKPIWQAGYYDHAIRKDEDIVHIARYIIANPIRAGLVKRVGDYSHWHAVWL